MKARLYTPAEIMAVEAEAIRRERAKVRWLEEQINTKELTHRCGHSKGYLCAMKRAGFIMPGGLGSVADVRAWLTAHPDFRADDFYNRRTPRPSAPVRRRAASAAPAPDSSALPVPGVGA